MASLSIVIFSVLFLCAWQYQGGITRLYQGGITRTTRLYQGGSTWHMVSKYKNNRSSQNALQIRDVTIATAPVQRMATELMADTGRNTHTRAASLSAAFLSSQVKIHEFDVMETTGVIVPVILMYSGAKSDVNWQNDVKLHSVRIVGFTGAKWQESC